MATHHAIVDGRSSSMFLRAWAYTCKYIFEKGEAPRLLPEEITPSFDWTTIKDSEGLEEAYLDFLASLGKDAGSVSHDTENSRNVKPMEHLQLKPNLLKATFELSMKDVRKLRESALRHHVEAANPTKRVNLSTYVLACAYTAICLVKARGSRHMNREVYFIWTADCRSRLDPPLPTTHFGNTIVTHHIVLKVGDFMHENGVAIIAETISDSIQSIDTQLFKGSKDRLRKLFSLGPEVQAVFVAGSTGLGIYNLDFGWGNVEKTELTSIYRSGSFSLLDLGNGSDRRIEIVVPLVRPEMEAFASCFSDGLQVIQSKQVP